MTGRGRIGARISIAGLPETRVFLLRRQKVTILYAIVEEYFACHRARHGGVSFVGPTERKTVRDQIEHRQSLATVTPSRAAGRPRPRVLRR